jgi:hypothetical protein
VASAVFTPSTRDRLLPGDDDYLMWAIGADRSWTDMVRQATSGVVDTKPAWLAVPLIDAEAYLRWCQHNGVGPDDGTSRARWAAEQTAGHIHHEGELPVVSGLMMMQQPGDFLCVALSLAAGWDGLADHIPPMVLNPEGWSRVRLQLGGYHLSIAIECNNPCRLLARLVLGQEALHQGHPPVDNMPYAGFRPHGNWRCYSTRGGLVVWYRPMNGQQG